MRDYAPPGTRLLLASSFVSTVPMGYLLVVLPLYLDRAGIQPAWLWGGHAFGIGFRRSFRASS
jgi:hypothetical protein